MSSGSSCIPSVSCGWSSVIVCVSFILCCGWVQWIEFGVLEENFPLLCL